MRQSIFTSMIFFMMYTAIFSSDTQITEVDMNEQKEILFNSSDKERQQIRTRGLNGCTAFAAFVTCANSVQDSSKIIMSHYSVFPKNREEQITKLEKSLDCACPQSAIESIKLIVLTPWDRSTKTKYDNSWFSTKSFIMKEDYQQIEFINAIANARSSIIPGDITQSTIPYYETAAPYYKDLQKAFTVTVDKGNISYTSLADGYKSHAL